MPFRRLLPYFLILASVWLPMRASSQATRPALWFEGARLIIGDKSPTIESSAFLVEGDSFTWVGKKGERQPPANATRVDLTGKTVMPTLIDGHNHIGLVNEKDGSNKKANYTRENLVDQLQSEESDMNDSIHNNLTRYLKEYNKEKNYLFILGYQRGSGILLASDSLDITKDVLKGLNKE